MEEQWKQFSENIRLTENQESDAQTKYEGVCTKLHTSYYSTDYDGSTKFLFGSYKTKTNVRPLTEKQDVDVIFKIPIETYEKYKNYKNNGPSALLQEVKGYLEKKYTTTDEIKAWGKVVLVKFKDGTHNIEVLPAYEKDDNTFIIPNSKNGGSWDKFDPRKQIDNFYSSNESTNGMTAELARMIKTWVKNTSTCEYKSFGLLDDVIKFFKNYFKSGANYSEYSAVVKKFFQFLKENCNDDIKSHVQTALDRATKAYTFENEKKLKEASEEWQKIFGKEFPLIESNPTVENNTRVFTNPSSPYGDGDNLFFDPKIIKLTNEDISFLQDKYPFFNLRY